MTKFPDGTPTYFINKIWLGLEADYYVDRYFLNFKKRFGKHWDETPVAKPKIHTIREDKSNRWKPGVIIDFFINSRTKDMFRFAPRLPVVSIQDILICHIAHTAAVYIDGEFFGEVYHHGLDDIYEWTNDLESLARNDGFDSIVEFFQYFKKDFRGKIIHWTELKY